MTLGERIAQARKQAGLSQEQLGEKLGVSRQAVSKWEGDQTNPDVAYVAQMCRTLGVSSDWLLLGEEAARNAAPERCPGCKAIVSGLDQFCPGCGRPLRDRAEHHQGYTMLLKKKDPLSQVDLARLSDLGKFSEDSPLHKPLSQVDVQTLAHSAPVVLARGLFSFFQDCEETDPLVLANYPGVDPETLISGSREPLSFGMVVLAVILGVVGAVFLLMLL